MELHRVGWVYIVLALVFSIVGSALLVEAGVNLSIPVLWIVANAMLFVMCYHAYMYWADTKLHKTITILYISRFDNVCTMD